MDTTIYDEIQKEIKKTDYYLRESFFTSVSCIVFCILVPITVWAVFLYDYIGYIILTAELLIFAFILQLWDFKLIREILRLCSSNMSEPLESLSRKDIFNFKKIKEKIGIIQKNRPQVLDIIKKYGITTNDGLEEAIEHYRFKASEAKQTPIDFLALFALAISIVSFFISDDNFFDNMSKTTVVLILILVFLIYIVFLYIYRMRFAKFSKKAFYTRIECALSEIRAANKLSSNEENDKERAADI